MAEMNRVFLIGRLTRDPELRYTPSGTAVVELRVAVNHSYRTKEGEKREETCFVDASILGRGAEVAKEYLAKGREVLLEGRLRFETWESKEGEKRSKHSVVVDRFQFLGGGRTADGGESSHSGNDGGAAESRGGQSRGAAAESNAEEMESGDDLPF